MGGYQAPKTNWTSNDGIQETDFNRIEENTKLIVDCLDKIRIKNNFYVFANNTRITGGSYYNVQVDGGDFFSESAVKGPVSGLFSITKILSSDTWTAGNSITSPCRVPGSATVGASDQWWYVFALYNPTTEQFDVCLDSNSTGGNIQGSAITAAGYTQWARVAAIFEDITMTDHLWNTYSCNGYTTVAVNRLYSGETVNVTGGTNHKITLETASNVSYVPDNFNIPVFLELEVNTPMILDIWGTSHGDISYTRSVNRLNFLNSADIKQLTIVTYLNEIYIRSNTTGTVTYSIRGWQFT